ncbi:MAG: hypothetical protein SPL61_09605 [Saccharofermentans sp.]|nr:hypothetical protein [Saccharofermentans sp.]
MTGPSDKYIREFVTSGGYSGYPVFDIGDAKIKVPYKTATFCVIYLYI